MTRPRFISWVILTLLPLTTCPRVFGETLGKRDLLVQYKVEGGQYRATLYRADWKDPLSVTIGDASEVESLPLDSSLYEGENSVRAYSLLISPFERYVRRGGNIYYLAAGAVHFINVEVLRGKDGKMACGKYRFFRVSDKNNLPRWEKKTKYDHKLLILFGGMNYEADFETMNSYSWIYHVKDFKPLMEDFKGTDVTELDFGKADDGTRAGYLSLRESRGEIKFIHGMESLFTLPRTGSRALEEEFRIQVRSNEPYYLHLSTHTFSSHMEGGHPQDRDWVYSHCGLLFSGAGHTLRGESMPYGLNDGLLYAKEISQMKMGNCELLVLAACNTALGTVTQDGVIGLQSAFKQAGVRTLVMTLWSVNDKATSEFMKRFYKYLFDGYHKHLALEKARADLMRSEDYNDPLYWAPFIMLD